MASTAMKTFEFPPKHEPCPSPIAMAPVQDLAPTSIRQPESPHTPNRQRKQSTGYQRARALSCWGPDGGASGLTHEKKVLVLCFDGTGNKFKGNSGDTNILKIFSMLDRRKGNQYHYYQPGIGTYLTSNAMTHKTARGMAARIKSAYHKAVDAAVGTSFDQHVMGGYKFLMRYYHPGDDIYMFGFSRGAYTARFLCEMLDHVGLVVQGNEEMVHFAWKTFSEWQMRQHADSPASKKKKEEMYNYMKAFRETFARPVKRIRFLGLFDTVNSVPRFENAWLNRGSKFPYTARSTARVIRHAVGLDERRAKFRLDLVEKVDMSEISDTLTREKEKPRKARSWGVQKNSIKRGIINGPLQTLTSNRFPGLRKHSKSLTDPYLLRMHLRANTTQGRDQWGLEPNPTASLVSLNIHFEKEDGDDEETEQDIEEVWFPGAHGDIGGGWDLAPGEPSLSYGPLVWMVREARLAGLAFDEKRLRELGCWTDLNWDMEDDLSDVTTAPAPETAHCKLAPTIAISSPSPTATTPPVSPHFTAIPEKLRDTSINAGSEKYRVDSVHLETVGDEVLPPQNTPNTFPEPQSVWNPFDALFANFDKKNGTSPIKTQTHNPLAKSSSRNDLKATPTATAKTTPKRRDDIDERTEAGLLSSYARGKIHCCLTFGGGLSPLGTLGWRMMEYLPFRRMDLQADGSWKSIIWPLPMGEVRDVPEHAKIHCSVLRRMDEDPTYRPGNLLVGGGGRGVRKAPKGYGTGEWIVLREDGSVVGETVIKKSSLRA